MALKAAFEGIGLQSAFESDEIEVIRPVGQPKRSMVGRRPFPILDLRTRSEDAYRAASRDYPFARHRTVLTEAYSTDRPVKDDLVFGTDDAVIFRGGVWQRTAPVLGSVMARTAPEIIHMTRKVAGAARSGVLPRLAGTTAVVQGPGARNYFHWTTEILPRFHALRDYITEDRGGIDRILLFHNGEPPDYARQSIRIFFPDLEPLVEHTTVGMVHLDRCLFFVDARSYLDTGSRMKTTTARLSDDMDSRLALRGGRGTRVIIASRADAPTRCIVNEVALVEALRDIGAECVAFGTLDFEGQMQLMAEARLVIGAHGAGLTNMMFCRAGTAVIEITSTQYIRRCRSYADIAMYRGLPYALAVADQHGENYVIANNRGNDIEIAPEGLAEIRRTALAMLSGEPMTKPLEAVAQPVTSPSPTSAMHP